MQTIISMSYAYTTGGNYPIIEPIDPYADLLAMYDSPFPDYVESGCNCIRREYDFKYIM